MIAVRFTRRHSLYNAGEIAGFDDVEASALIEAGIVAPVTKPEPEGTITKGIEPEPEADSSAGEPTRKRR